MNLARELEGIIKGEVGSDKKTLGAYSRDASLFKVQPRVVVFPKDAEDIKTLARFVSKNKKEHPELSLTVRSGGTDMTGGPLNESIIVDVSKYLNRMKEIGKDYAVVEPGMFYRDFEKETKKKGLLMPSYPASREICTVGGMVANNAGGEKTLTYGKTEDYVKEVKMVLRDGEEYAFAPLNKTELDKKMKLASAEGEVYRKVFDVVDKNYELLKKAKPSVSKNSAGYFLWNMWNKETFDMPKLIVGSQGTLGIVTEVTFRLVRPKTHSTLLVVFLKDVGKLADVVMNVLRHKPESFESYDDKTMKVALRFLPSMIKLLGAGNILSLAWQFRREFLMVVTGGVPELVLVAEFTGGSEEEIYKKARSAEKDLEQFDVKIHVTKGKTQESSDREERKYFAVRRESFNLLRHHVAGRRTAPFIDDIIVRPEKLPEFLPKLDLIMRDYELVYTVAGHIGDGNLHIIPLVKVDDPRVSHIIPELSGKVYDLVLEFGGSITAEHNDGLIRSPFLKKMYGENVYKLFEETKRAFDPENIFNPGKKVGSTLEYAMEHLDL